ncbi:glycosyltransferase family 9 protein [Glaciecola sp. MH2013]|uniref:glycosyltransferase family 9 protein n=1 Tax=Glaciecola sp. MH2013 TaxID=2785524 RepID=UPI00189E5019|nr:glycosyltransferase family 9 protein [Glaciecola sp. MH2013]MBF7073369.1 glycosyltransferase family 9 protein [Glaciecola sp. MH2013]
MSTPFQLCILRLSAIGDVCHAVAMVTRIQQYRPDIKITWIIGKIEHQLIEGMPGVEFIIYDKKAGKAAKEQVKNALNGRVFDALFVMQVALRANLLSRVVKAKRRIGFDWKRSKEGHRLFANEYIEAKQYAHVLDGFMGFADKLDIPKVQTPSWKMPVSEDDWEWAARQTQSLGKYVVISPAASKAERNWTVHGYVAVAKHLSDKGYKVVLCGGPGPLDADISERILAQSDCIALNLVAKTSLKQMLAVLAKADLVLAPDTGPAHMATAMGTKVVGLYAHSNYRRTGPYLSQECTASVYEIHIKEQKGKKWVYLPWGIRAKGKDLMTHLLVQSVLKKVDLALSQLDSE